MFLWRHMTENSLSSIGEALGVRDHVTVQHACRLVKDRMEVDANVRQVVLYLEMQLMRQPPPGGSNGLAANAQEIRGCSKGWIGKRSRRKPHLLEPNFRG